MNKTVKVKLKIHTEPTKQFVGAIILPNGAILKTQKHSSIDNCITELYMKVIHNEFAMKMMLIEWADELLKTVTHSSSIHPREIFTVPLSENIKQHILPKYINEVSE